MFSLPFPKMWEMYVFFAHQGKMASAVFNISSEASFIKLHSQITTIISYRLIVNNILYLCINFNQFTYENTICSHCHAHYPDEHLCTGY